MLPMWSCQAARERRPVLERRPHRARHVGFDHFGARGALVAYAQILKASETQSAGRATGAKLGLRTGLQPVCGLRSGWGPSGDRAEPSLPPGSLCSALTEWPRDPDPGGGEGQRGEGCCPGNPPAKETQPLTGPKKPERAQGGPARLLGPTRPRHPVPPWSPAQRPPMVMAEPRLGFPRLCSGGW